MSEWNDRFDPIPVYPDGREQPRLPPGSCLVGVFDPANLPEYSMRCADWCDAKAYCEWAGTRLCGGLGALEETLETRADPSVSEWQYACTSRGLFPYPYGMEVRGRKVHRPELPPNRSVLWLTRERSVCGLRAAVRQDRRPCRQCRGVDVGL
jgi:hypothetical protein